MPGNPPTSVRSRQVAAELCILREQAGLYQVPATTRDELLDLVRRSEERG